MAGAIILAGCGGGTTTSTRPLEGTAATTPAVAESPTTTPATGSGVVTPSKTSPTTTSKPTTTTRPASRPSTVITITSGSGDGATVAVRVGDHVKLLLDDSGMQWSNVVVSPSGLLAPAPAPSPPAHGQLLIWLATQPGTVTITAVGTAWCAAGVACPMYARLFKVTLAIS